MTFTELRIGAFRALVDVTLPLRPLNVIIGPNGAGKTTLLETFVFLQYLGDNKLTDAISFFGGITSITPLFPSSPKWITLEAKIGVFQNFDSDNQVAYHITVGSTGNGNFFVQREAVTFDGDNEPRDIKSGTSDALGLSQFARHGNSNATPFRAIQSQFSRTKFYRPINVARSAPVRIPQTLVPITDPGANGENLFPSLYNLRENHPDQFEYIKDVLRTAFQGFQDLTFPAVGGGIVTLGWKQKELNRILYPNELSEGTLRFLWLITLLLSPEPAPLTLIDEPEVSLHPELLQLLAGVLQTAALRGQVIVATQSADLIRWLDPADIVIADKEDGKVRFTRGDEIPVIEEWIQEYTLGELWRMGVLGGRE
jgi:predicted ATPase